MIVRGNDIYGAWVRLLELLLQAGRPVNPRGTFTKELVGVQLRVADASQNIILDRQRKLNYRFLVAEWLWTLYGLHDLKLVSRFNRAIDSFSTDGQGNNYPAYGPELHPQWPYVASTLTRDPESRQAVASIWRAQRDGDSQGHVVPCTLSMQFLLRRRPFDYANHGWALHTVVTMRSSDAWLGIPYDFFNFSMLANRLASVLQGTLKRSVTLGELVLNLGSSHLYQRDWEDARSIVNAPTGSALASPPLPVDFLNLPTVDKVLSGELTYEPPAPGSQWGPVWNRYADVLVSRTSAEALSYLVALGERRGLEVRRES